MEALEQRQLLTITASIIAGPETTQGNSWTYGNEDGSSSVVTVIGPSGADTELDTVDYGTDGSLDSTQRDYLLSNANGLYRDNETLSSSGVSVSHIYSAPQMIAPASLSVGSPVTNTVTNTYTVTTLSTGESNTTSRVDSNTLSLASDTTTSISTPAGVFNCYEVDQTLVWTYQDENDVTTITSKIFVAAGVGIVQETSNDTTSGGGSGSSSKTLTKFTSSDRLVFTQQPTNVPANQSMQPAVTVSLEDSTGDVITSGSGTVTLSLIGVNSANPVTGTTATLTDGVATFSDIQFTKSGTYQFQANDTGGDAMATSNKFGVTGDKLQYLVQPRNTDVDSPLTLSVEALDSQGKLDVQNTDGVTLNLNVLQGSTSAVLGGMLSGTLSGGKLVFALSNNISVNAAGTYTITAAATTTDDSGATTTDYGVAAATSNSFTVTGLKLVLSKQPAKTGDVNVPIAFTVQAVNSKGQRATTDSTDVVQVALNTISGGAGANLRGTTSMTLTDGVATFSSSAGPTITSPGAYTFTLSVPDSTTITSVDSNQFTIAGLHLAFLKLPHTVDIQTAFPFSVQLLDSKNKLVTTENTASVALSFTTVSSKADNPTLTGTTTADFTGGLASFTTSAGPMFSDPGVFALTATETGIATGGADVSDTLPTTPAQISTTRFQLKFLTKPQNTGAGDAFATSVAVEASNGTIRSSENTDQIQIALNIVSGGENAQLQGTTTYTLTAGYINASTAINTAGTYTLTYTEIDPTTGEQSDATAPITSAQFKITGDHYAFVNQLATNLDPYESFDVKVAVETSQNKIDTQANTAAKLTLNTVSGGAGATTTAPTFDTGVYVSFNNGVAEISGQMNYAPGTFTFSLDDEPQSADSAVVESGTSKPFKVVPLHVAIKQQPSSGPAYSSLGGSVSIEDTSGHIDTGFPTTGADLSAMGSNDGAIDGKTSFVDGVASLNPVAISTPGSYSLGIAVTPVNGDSSGPDPVVSRALTISADHLIVSTQPVSGSVGAQIPVTVQLVDEKGNVVTNEATSDSFSFSVVDAAGNTVNNAVLVNPSNLFYAAAGVSTQFSTGSSQFTVGINQPGTYTLVFGFEDVSGTAGSAAVGQVTTNPFTIG